MKQNLTLNIKRRLGLPLSFGDLGSTEPASRTFGYDRGTPVDRYYIEDFLSNHADRIMGHTLEIGDDTYTARFGGGKTTTREVLHIDGNHPSATYRGDLTSAGVLPCELFDCAVITQTLHLIYDMKAAIVQLYAALRPGGALLITVPGISQIADDRWSESWYWSLTPRSLERLLGQCFGYANVTVSSYGNVLAATAFLRGLCLEELPRKKLDVRDGQYPVIVAALAIKSPLGR